MTISYINYICEGCGEHHKIRSGTIHFTSNGRILCDKCGKDNPDIIFRRTIVAMQSEIEQGDKT